MASGSIWIRHDVDWDSDDWLDRLEWPVRACWMELQAACKVYGRSGTCPAIDLRRMSRAKRIPEEFLRECAKAAIEAREIIEVDGMWVFANWKRSQEADSSERVRRFRERQQAINAAMSASQQETHGNDTQQSETQCNVTPVTLYARPQPQPQPQQESEPSGSGGEPPAPTANEWEGVPEGERPQWARTRPNLGWLMTESVLWQLHQRLEELGIPWEAPTEADIRRDLKNDGPLWSLVAEHGEDGALDMFVWAATNWSTLPSGWPQIYSQRRQIAQSMSARASPVLASVEQRAAATADQAKAKLAEMMGGRA